MWWFILHAGLGITKRQDIIETAARLFARHGYRSIGVDRIIAESGIAKMTMYRHFKSKEDLVVTVLEIRMAAIDESLRKHVSTGATPAARVQALFDWYDRWFRSKEFTGCMFIHAASEYGTDNQRITSVVASQKQALRDIFLSVAMEAGLDRRAALRLSTSLVMLIDGAIINRETFGNRRAAREAWETAKALLSPGFG